MRDYAFDQGFADERKRLSAMESLWDPGSEALLVELDVRTDALPQSAFDLVHARLLLERLADRRQILDRLPSPPTACHHH
jgi:hypothetical protein